MDGRNVINALNKGRVKITFTSLNSGRDIEGIYTLRGRHVGLNPKTDVIVAWDLVDEKWQDIKVDSITQFILVDL